MVKFNEQQLKAINFHKGACAVIAGAGSGKSTVLLNRIKTLANIHNVPQDDILAISFTKNTADELKNKLFKMGLPNVNVGTFHSICGRILIQEGIQLQGRLIQDWQVKNCLQAIDRKADVKDILGFISYQKNYLKTYKDEFIPKDSYYNEDELRTFFKGYEDFKKQNNLIDFDDYLILCYDILTQNKNKYTYDFILVDEHQDSNLVQNLLIKELCPSKNVFCVFDYRQAIYSFRGGNTEYCMNFEEDWENATVINLDTNYRSSSDIVNSANGFIKKYYGDYVHYSDSIPSTNEKGNIKIDSYDDKGIESIKVVDDIEKLLKDGKKPSQIAILYRTNSQISNVENELRYRGIEYEISNDSSFFKRKEIEGIMAYLRLILNPHDDDAFEKIFKLRNDPLAFFSNKVFDDIKQYSGTHDTSLYESFIEMKYDKTWQKSNVRAFEETINKLRLQKYKDINLIKFIDNVIKSFKMEKYIEEKYTSRDEIEDRLESLQVLKTFVKGNDLEKFISYVYSATNTKKKFKKDCIKLMSVHASKGLEFEDVFLIGVEDEKFPHKRSDLLEEARLFYVAVTRPKDNLYISQIGTGNQFIEEYIR